LVAYGHGGKGEGLVVVDFDVDVDWAGIEKGDPIHNL